MHDILGRLLLDLPCKRWLLGCIERSDRPDDRHTRIMHQRIKKSPNVHGKTSFQPPRTHAHAIIAMPCHAMQCNAGSHVVHTPYFESNLNINN